QDGVPRISSGLRLRRVIAMGTHTFESEMPHPGLDVARARQPARDVRAYVVDDPEDGMFTVDRALFSDPELFELEMKYIFEGTWVYLAHESQLPRPHDFYTTSIGRQPVILMRDQAGEIGGFINTCPHRGATVCLTKRGNQKVLTCPYHGWSFNTSGALVGGQDHAT